MAHNIISYNPMRMHYINQWEIKKNVNNSFELEPGKHVSQTEQ